MNSSFWDHVIPILTNCAYCKQIFCNYISMLHLMYAYTFSTATLELHERGAVVEWGLHPFQHSFSYIRRVWLSVSKWHLFAIVQTQPARMSCCIPHIILIHTLYRHQVDKHLPKPWIELISAWLIIIISITESVGYNAQLPADYIKHVLVSCLFMWLFSQWTVPFFFRDHRL